MTCLAAGAQSPELEKGSSQDKIKVDVDLTLVTATVTDIDGQPIIGLIKDNFQVWEDRVEQDIKYFSADEVPVSTGIVLDVSGSMAAKISAARDAATSVLRTANREDEFFLVEFSSRAQVAEDFSTDISNLQNRLIFNSAKGRTALFDATYLALERIERARNSRRALVLISDGEDNHSRYTFENISQFVREADVQIFAIGLETYLSAMHDGVRSGREHLERLAKLTGGKAYFPKSIRELPAICRQIALEIKSQYVLGYEPTNTAKDGAWRKIRLKVNPPMGIPNLHVRGKTGYYAPAAGGQ